MPSARQVIFRVIVPVLISASLVYLLLGSTGVDDLTEALYTVSLRSYAVFVLCWLGSSVARAAAYSILLHNRLRSMILVPLMWIRSFAVDLLPARSGLAAIPLTLRLVWNVSISEGIAVLAGASIAEFASLGVALLLALPISGSGLGRQWTWFFAVLGTALTLALPVALFLFGWIGGLTSRGRILSYVVRISAQAYRLRQRGILLPVFCLTLITRVLKYTGLYVLFRSLVPSGLTPVAFVAAMISAESTSSLPVQGLAGVGTWEAVWVAAATSFGLAYKTAVASGFGIHLLVLGWEIVMGLTGLLVLLGLQKRGGSRIVES